MDSWKGGRGLPPLRAWGSGPQREDKDLSLARLLCCCCVIIFLLGESYCSQPPDLCHPVRFQLASRAPRPLPSFLPQICCCCSCLIFSWVESINEPVSSLKQSIFWNVGRISDFAVWNVQGDAGTLVQESSFFFKMAFSHKVCLYTWNLWIILTYRDINLLKSFMVKNTRCRDVAERITCCMMSLTEITKIEKLNGRNYQSWKYNVKLVLMERGLWGFTQEGRETPPAADGWRWYTGSRKLLFLQDGFFS